MDSGKWTIAGLLIASALVIVGANENEHVYRKDIQVLAWTGDDLHFKCGDNRSDSAGRLWVKQKRTGSTYVRTALASSDRFSFINNSTVLRIVNATFNDSGFYVCTVLTQPSYDDGFYLAIQDEKVCYRPDDLDNGSIRSYNWGREFKRGETVEYICNKYHRLIGPSIRTCTGTPRGWEPEAEPHCEPHFLRNINKQLESIDDKFDVIARIVTKMWDKVSELDKRTSALDNKPSNTRSGQSSIGSEISLIESIKKDTVEEPGVTVCPDYNGVVDQDTPDKCCTMQLGVRDGRNVSVFQWTLDANHTRKQEGDRDRHESRMFCQTVPGYIFRLTLFIRSKGNIDTDLRYVPREDDEHLIWPFITPFDVTVFLNDGTEMLYKNFTGDHPTCAVSRPDYQQSISCTYENPQWENVVTNKKFILKDGSVVFKVYMYN